MIQNLSIAVAVLLACNAGARTIDYQPDSQSVISCAGMELTDIELQPGERLGPDSIQFGDSVRWSAAVVDVGATMHVIVKPKDTIPLNTSLLIATDRRVYRLRLVSGKVGYTPIVRFSYPAEALPVAVAQARPAPRPAPPVAAAEPEPEKPEYSIDGDAPWKPLRVWNENGHTYIDMPPSMSTTDAPVPIVVIRPGGLFRSEELKMVNFKLEGRRFTIDGVPDRIILIAGVSDSQDRIDIEKVR